VNWKGQTAKLAGSPAKPGKARFASSIIVGNGSRGGRRNRKIGLKLAEKRKSERK
jgi:hypothetical protein